MNRWIYWLSQSTFLCWTYPLGIVPQHGLPVEHLSDHGKAYLSKQLYKVYKLMGMKKNKHHLIPSTD